MIRTVTPLEPRALKVEPRARLSDRRPSSQDHRGSRPPGSGRGVWIAAVGMLVSIAAIAVLMFVGTESNSNNDDRRGAVDTAKTNHTRTQPGATNGSSTGNRNANQPLPENRPVWRTRVEALPPGTGCDFRADVLGVRIRSLGLTRQQVSDVGDALHEILAPLPDLANGLASAGHQILLVPDPLDFERLPTIGDQAANVGLGPTGGIDSRNGDGYLVITGTERSVLRDQLEKSLAGSTFLLAGQDEIHVSVPSSVLEATDRLCRGDRSRRFVLLDDSNTSTGQLFSGPSRETVILMFDNRLDRPVTVEWVNFQSKPQRLFDDLPPGGRLTLQSFAGHSWIVTVDGRVHSTWVLSSGDRRQLIEIE